MNYPVPCEPSFSTASMNGSVHDSTGALVPAATLVLHSVATGVDLISSTNNSGEYVFANIAPGKYTLRVSKAGFQSAQQAAFDLEVNQTVQYGRFRGSSAVYLSAIPAATLCERMGRRT